MEYTITSLKKDINNLENVQYRAARLAPILKNCYDDRLKALKWTTLDIRRKRRDLIEVYKILNGLECVVWKN